MIQSKLPNSWKFILFQQWKWIFASNIDTTIETILIDHNYSIIGNSFYLISERAKYQLSKVRTNPRHFLDGLRKISSQLFWRERFSIKTPGRKVKKNYSHKNEKLEKTIQIFFHFHRSRERNVFFIYHFNRGKGRGAKKKK